MKYRKRSTTFALMAGLMVLTISCRQSTAKLSWITSRHLANFPSASAIEYFNNRLLVLGDDARCLLILDTAFQYEDSVCYFTDSSYRIPRSRKPDIESVVILPGNNLFALGSFADDKRNQAYSFTLSDPHQYRTISYPSTYFKNPGIAETNIEGMALVGKNLVLAQRANLTETTNKFLVTTAVNYSGLGGTVFKGSVIPVRLPGTGMIRGISGLCYYPAMDILFFTASEEATASATADGVIGNSYLGWINRISEKLGTNEIRPDQLIDLSELDQRFIKQKVESVCVQEVTKKNCYVYLAADNDNGESTLFKLKLEW